MSITSNLNASDYGKFKITHSITKVGEEATFWFKEKSTKNEDNGWRIVGKNDTQSYLENKDNWSLVGAQIAVDIMPMIIDIFDAPIGASYKVEYTKGRLIKSVYDLNKKEYLYYYE